MFAKMTDNILDCVVLVKFASASRNMKHITTEMLIMFGFKKYLFMYACKNIIHYREFTHIEKSLLSVKDCKRYARRPPPLSSEGSIVACNIYRDTGQSILFKVIIEDTTVTTCFYDFGLCRWD